MTLCVVVGYIYLCCKSNNLKVNPGLFRVSLIMKYFTLSEDLEEIQSSKLKLRNRIIGGLGLLILFFVLRSLGLLSIEYNKVYLHGEHQNRKEISEYYNNGTGSKNTNNATLKTNDDDFYRQFGFSSKFRDFSPPENESLEKLIKEKISKERVLSRQFDFSAVSVKNLEMSGAYWLPLIKKGTNSYRIFVENRYFQDTYSADFTGDIAFEVHGICTVENLNRIMADKIAKIVVDSIKNDYKK